MAKFGENTLKFKNVMKFNRIPITCVEDQWFIMTGKNSVIKVQDSKALHTWTLMQGHIRQFTSPVAFFDGKLYSVIDHTVLIRWSVEDDNLENAESFKFQEKIYTLIHLPGVEPLIIFASGKFAVIDIHSLDDLKPSDCISLKQVDSLDWVDATVTDTSIEVFYHIYNKETHLDTLYYFSVNKEDKSSSPILTHNISQVIASFKCCCIDSKDLLFFSLWSDGTLRCYNIKDKKDTSVLFIEDIDADTVVDINGFDSQHIIIAKGTTKSQECILEVWDTKRAIIRGRKAIQTPELSILQIVANREFLFMSFAFAELMAVPFYVDISFYSTLNTSESKGFHQHSWSEDLKLVPIPVLDEPEKMDISRSEQDAKDSLELMVEKLLNQNLPKLIPESELIKILQFVISHKKESQKNFSKDMYSLLNVIFASSYSELLLAKYLKKLNIGDSLVALELLLFYLKHSENIPADLPQMPTDLQIVNWICLIISSHTEALLFTKEKAAKKLMKDLKTALSFKIEEYNDLEGLQSYVSLLQKKQVLPQEHSVEKYCIESLDI